MGSLLGEGGSAAGAAPLQGPAVALAASYYLVRLTPPFKGFVPAGWTGLGAHRPEFYFAAGAGGRGPESEVKSGARGLSCRASAKSASA